MFSACSENCARFGKLGSPGRSHATHQCSSVSWKPVRLMVPTPVRLMRSGVLVWDVRYSTSSAHPMVPFVPVAAHVTPQKKFELVPNCCHGMVLAEAGIRPQQ